MSSISNNEIKRIRSLQQKKFRDESGLFVVEGEKMVAEALASAFSVESVYRKEEIGEEAMKKISSLSDGNRMKLMLSGVLARDTELLLLDEPASPLDPLMRDVLCDLIREYIEAGQGEKSVFFSTHNIADMENVTDYAIIMERGRVVEQGFVEDLKEKYILVKGEASDIPTAEKILYSITKNSYGYEGICLAEDMNKLAGLDIEVSTPSLSQISVAVMKKGTKIHLQ